MTLVFMLMVPLGVFAKESDSDASSITENFIQQVDKNPPNGDEKTVVRDPTVKSPKTEMETLAPIIDNAVRTE